MGWQSYIYKPKEKTFYWVLRRHSNGNVVGECACWYGWWSEKSGQVLFWKPLGELPPGLQVVSRMSREHTRRLKVA